MGSPAECEYKGKDSMAICRRRVERESRSEMLGKRGNRFHRSHCATLCWMVQKTEARDAAPKVNLRGVQNPLHFEMDVGARVDLVSSFPLRLRHLSVSYSAVDT